MHFPEAVVEALLHRPGALPVVADATIGPGVDGLVGTATLNTLPLPRSTEEAFEPEGYPPLAGCLRPS